MPCLLTPHPQTSLLTPQTAQFPPLFSPIELISILKFDPQRLDQCQPHLPARMPLPVLFSFLARRWTPLSINLRSRSFLRVPPPHSPPSRICRSSPKLARRITTLLPTYLSPCLLHGFRVCFSPRGSPSSLFRMPTITTPTMPKDVIIFSNPEYLVSFSCLFFFLFFFCRIALYCLFSRSSNLVPPSAAFCCQLCLHYMWKSWRKRERERELMRSMNV